MGPLVDTHAHIYLADQPQARGATHKPERAFTAARLYRFA
jgi:predicted TIM-barrel fold metal-dependent hydrolase